MSNLLNAPCGNCLGDGDYGYGHICSQCRGTGRTTMLLGADRGMSQLLPPETTNVSENYTFKNDGYHLTKISRGIFGEVSKIVEEAHELQDAETQGVKIMQLVELSDLVGAIGGYLAKHHPDVAFDDLQKMSAVTERAFKNGHRQPRRK